MKSSYFLLMTSLMIILIIVMAAMAIVTQPPVCEYGYDLVNGECVGGYILEQNQ
jgi:hypothetical protein